MKAGENFHSTLEIGEEIRRQCGYQESRGVKKDWYRIDTLRRTLVNNVYRSSKRKNAVRFAANFWGADEYWGEKRTRKNIIHKPRHQ